MTHHTVLLRGGRVTVGDGEDGFRDVLLADGRIDAIGEGLVPEPGTEVVDLKGHWLLPGFIDLHVHGGGGFSLITTDREEVRSYARWVVSQGVTAFLATICGDSLAHGLACTEAAAGVVGPVDRGATVLGLNLEGPFVSRGRAGALPADWIQEPDPAVLRDLVSAGAGCIRVMTVAPELVGADRLIATLCESGVVPAIGHTDATYEQTAATIRAGARHVTHAFNAMRPLHHREPGPIPAAWSTRLEDGGGGVTIELIADGVHLHPVVVDLLAAAFGPSHICLVTDAVRPAGLSSGVFRVGGQDARLGEDGSIRLSAGTIAGSSATMASVVRGLSWEWHAVAQAASANPARVLGLEERKGRMAVGFDADIVALTEDRRVAKTWVAGRLVYEAAEDTSP